MGATTDKVQGKVKEAAGAILDDDKLRREGKIDQAAGKAKEAVGKVVQGAAKDDAECGIDAAKQAAKKANDGGCCSH